MRICAVALALLGVAALLTGPHAKAEPHAASTSHASIPTSSTTVVGAGPVTTAGTRAAGGAATAAGVTTTDLCAGVTKHGPGPTSSDEFSTPPEREVTANRRILATGSYGDSFWRLSLAHDGPYGHTDIDLDDARKDGSGGGGSGTEASGPPLLAAGGNLGTDGWAFYGKARADSKCVVATTKSGQRVVTDEFARDSGYPNAVFFVAIAAYDHADVCGGSTVESFDAAGKRTGSYHFGEVPAKYREQFHCDN